MRTSIFIRAHAPRRVDTRRRATRVTAMALALAAFHFASVAPAIVAKARAQGLTPSLPSDPDPKDLVRAELIAGVDALAPGRPFRLAVRLEIKEGWHVNWLNPGDAGMAPGIEWRLPKGFKATLVCWPYPERFRAGPLVIFGYSKELLLVTEVTPPADLPLGASIKLGAEVTWLACEEACIPGSASLSLTLPVEPVPRTDPKESAHLDEWQKRCPGPSGPWNVDASLGDRQTLLLDLQTAEDDGATLKGVFFYLYEPGIMENAATQSLSLLQSPRGRSAYQLRVELSPVATQIPDRVRGILVMDDGGTRAIEVDVPLRRR